MSFLLLIPSNGLSLMKLYCKQEALLLEHEVGSLFPQMRPPLPCSVLYTKMFELIPPTLKNDH